MVHLFALSSPFYKTYLTTKRQVFENRIRVSSDIGTFGSKVKESDRETRGKEENLESSIVVGT